MPDQSRAYAVAAASRPSVRDRLSAIEHSLRNIDSASNDARMFIELHMPDEAYYYALTAAREVHVIAYLLREYHESPC